MKEPEPGKSEEGKEQETQESKGPHPKTQRKVFPLQWRRALEEKLSQVSRGAEKEKGTR